MLSEEKIALSKIRLDNAKERIAFADEILAIGDYKTVANRSYYAVFFCNACCFSFGWYGF